MLALVRIAFALVLVLVGAVLLFAGSVSEETALAIFTAAIGLASASSLDTATRAFRDSIERRRDD